MKKVFFLGLALILFISISLWGRSYFFKKEETFFIPKTIHFVWLGSKNLPQEVEQVIQNWRKYMPDYKIKRWDETNCDVTANHYIKTVYQKKKYDFASDWCRLLALEEGGIYFDTDMLLNQSIEPLLDAPLVLTVQEKGMLSASFMAVQPHSAIVENLKKKYINRLNTTEIAPSVWSRVFLELFVEEEIKPQKSKKGYHIYPPNILMYDFKGGENRAEHIFSNGNPNNLEKSKFYQEFREKFLHEFAYYLEDKRSYFIKKDHKKGYLIDAETKNKLQDVSFKHFLGILYLYDGKKNFYFCNQLICRLIFK